MACVESTKYNSLGMKATDLDGDELQSDELVKDAVGLLQQLCSQRGSPAC